jgi:threonine dehydratase
VGLVGTAAVVSESQLPAWASRSAIEEAYARIRSHVRETPLLQLPRGALGVDTPITLKLEYLQHAGSFKPRGAFNTLLSRPTPDAGVAAASGGNHGIAVAYACKSLGKKARVFVPEISSPAKIAAIRAHGAELVVGGARYADAQEACDRFVRETGALSIHPFDAETTIAGQGTVALEWEAQAGASMPDTILVASGGGGLVAGMCAWFAEARTDASSRARARTRVIAVEPAGSRALHAALEAGAPVDVPVESVAADSLGARNVGPRVFAVANAANLRVLLVQDTHIAEAQRALWRDFRLAVEPGGAAAAAALIGGAYRPEPGERVGVLVCGANVDLAALARVVT